MTREQFADGKQRNYDLLYKLIGGSGGNDIIWGIVNQTIYFCFFFSSWREKEGGRGPRESTDWWCVTTLIGF